MSQQPYSDINDPWYATGEDVLGELFKGDSQLSEELRDIAYNLNRQYIGAEIENSYQDITGSLSGDQARQTGANAVDWLSNPINLIMTFLGVVGSIILIRKL